MTDPSRTFRETCTHLENLIQQVDDRDLDEAIALIGALLDRRYPTGGDGPVTYLIPVAPQPARPARKRDD